MSSTNVDYHSSLLLRLFFFFFTGMGAGDPGALKGAIDRCKNELQRDPDNEALAAVLKGMNDFAAYYAAESRFLTRIKETYEEALRKYVTLGTVLHLHLMVISTETPIQH